MKNNLVLFYPGCISFEVQLAIELVGNVQAISLDGADHRDHSGLVVRTRPLSSVDAEYCGSLLVPGGNPAAIVGNAAVQNFIRSCLSTGGVIGGICAGVLVLADAGVLHGRKITHNYQQSWGCSAEVIEKTRDFWSGTTVIDAPCVVDGPVVTALPFAHIDFATVLGQRLGLLSEDEAERKNSYYKGRPATGA